MPDGLTRDTVLQATIELIEVGIRVFPIRLVWEGETLRKIPACAHGLHGASLAPKQIRAWFSTGDYVIGVPTGAQNNLTVVDVDPRHTGDVWYGEHQDQIPPTRRHETMQGGWHLVFNHHDGIRNSTDLIAPGVDVRGEGGFVVWWPASGLPCTDDPITDMPDWLAEAAMKGRARHRDGEVSLNDRKPPSARAVIELLRRMPNPAETSRDVYVDVNLATKGCIDALIEADALPLEDEIAIEEAAIDWSYRWEGGSTTDEEAKWDADWRYRDAKLAGWQTLQKIAGALIPEFREEQARQQFAEPPPPEKGQPYKRTPFWPSMLHVTEKGAYKAVAINAIIALRYAPEWDGVLGFNEFTSTVEFLRPPPYAPSDSTFIPRAVEDVDVIDTQYWLQSQKVFVPKNVTSDAMRANATTLYHPVRAYLDSLVWDGQPRLDTWFTRDLGVEDTALHRAYSARFLISAVARVRQPGCKVDTVPVLEGPQNLGKSTALRILAGPWFIDHMPDLHSKDAQMQIEGIWIVEFAELGQFSKADANHAKIFISTQFDRFRRPYGLFPGTRPRQCVLAVTLNRGAHGYLKDETGNRRFWPALCGALWEPGCCIDLEALKATRDQLWAEADYRFGQGERWWLHEPELLAAHESSVSERLDLEPMHHKITKAMERLVADGKTEPTLRMCAASWACSR